MELEIERGAGFDSSSSGWSTDKLVADKNGMLTNDEARLNAIHSAARGVNWMQRHPWATKLGMVAAAYGVGLATNLFENAGSVHAQVDFQNCSSDLPPGALLDNNIPEGIQASGICFDGVSSHVYYADTGAQVTPEVTVPVDVFIYPPDSGSVPVTPQPESWFSHLSSSWKILDDGVSPEEAVTGAVVVGALTAGIAALGVAIHSLISGNKRSSKRPINPVSTRKRRNRFAQEDQLAEDARRIAADEGRHEDVEDINEETRQRNLRKYRETGKF